MVQCARRYHEYEWNLEQLRRVRRKARAITGKRSLADYGIVRRIHFIFERATRKFKGELSVWAAWLDFCKASGSSRQVSKVVTKALKLHPSAPFLWTHAAAWCALPPDRWLDVRAGVRAQRLRHLWCAMSANSEASGSTTHHCRNTLTYTCTDSCASVLKGLCRTAN
jgi:hypothetical protein